jgi:hypothetical protein
MSFIRPLLWSVSLCAAASPTIAQNPEATATSTYRVSGIVVDRDGNPLANAEVTLLTGGVIRVVIPSGEDGRFNLGSHTAGKATLQVRRLGYEQRNMNLKIGDDSKATFAEIVLVELPQKLEEVLVKSDEQGRLREFAAHRAERNNFGYYFDRSEIRKRNPAYASELFRVVPGVQVRATAGGGNTVRVRGCMPLLWMDGQRVPGAELDEVARPSDIAGVEFYSSNAGIPAEFMDRDNGACGIIVVWSKSQ